METLAAKVSVPGGGSVAAYAGAIASALCSMVGEFTHGKKLYARYDADIERILEELERIRHRFLELVDEDARALEPLTQAYSISRDDPERQSKLDAATKHACKAPLEMMELCGKTIELIEEMAQKSSKLLISDAGCSAFMASAALSAASLNVFVNTASISDRAWAEDVERRADELLSTFGPRANVVASHVVAEIRRRS